MQSVHSRFSLSPMVNQLLEEKNRRWSEGQLACRVNLRGHRTIQSPLEETFRFADSSTELDKCEGSQSVMFAVITRINRQLGFSSGVWDGRRGWRLRLSVGTWSGPPSRMRPDQHALCVKLTFEKLLPNQPPPNVAGYSSSIF